MFGISFRWVALFVTSVLLIGGCIGGDTSSDTTDGLPVSGGKTASGGGKFSGGSISTGGSAGMGGATGGIHNAGGTMPTAGTWGTGGSSTAGGTSFSSGGTDAGEVGSDTGFESFFPDMGVAGKVSTGGVTSSGGVVISGGTVSTGGVSAAGGTNHTGKWRIMPVGDSITGTTCYPQLLSKNLIVASHSNFEFVGSVLNNQACQASHVQTEGHGGWLVTSLLPSGSNANVQTKWFNDVKPEIVILHFATNDLWNNVPPATILSAYSLIVDSARAAVPNAIFFVAQIVPLAPSSCSECPARTSAFNALIPAWATGKAKSNSPIHVVDLASGWVPGVDTGDGVHPNLVGSKKMADRMTQAIIDRKLF